MSSKKKRVRITTMSVETVFYTRHTDELLASKPVLTLNKKE